MSITDELREYALGWDERNRVRRDLRAIADRIDAEHERQLVEARAEGMQEGFAADKGPREFVELPKDADGEYIRVGDVMELTRLSNKPSFEVRAMRYDEGGWEVFDRLGDRYEPFALRHYHAPTVEDVLREFAYGLGVPVADSYVAATAAKLRLAGDAE